MSMLFIKFVKKMIRECKGGKKNIWLTLISTFSTAFNRKICHKSDMGSTHKVLTEYICDN